MKIHLRYYDKECDKVRCKLESLEARLAPREEYWQGMQVGAADPMVILKQIKRRANMALEERQAVVFHTGRPTKKLPPFTDNVEEEAVRFIRRKGFWKEPGD